MAVLAVESVATARGPDGPPLIDLTSRAFSKSDVRIDPRRSRFALGTARACRIQSQFAQPQLDLPRRDPSATCGRARPCAGRYCRAAARQICGWFMARNIARPPRNGRFCCPASRRSRLCYQRHRQARPRRSKLLHAQHLVLADRSCAARRVFAERSRPMAPSPWSADVMRSGTS